MHIFGIITIICILIGLVSHIGVLESSNDVSVWRSQELQDFGGCVEPLA